MSQYVKDWLRKHPHWKDIEKLMSKVSSSGFDIFIVGGAIRDALLKRAIKDIDLASSAKPKQIVKIFPKAKSNFAKYGVIFIPLKNNHKIEITTFRKDTFYKDGRRPQYIKYSTIKEDAKRRDFTINALFYDLKTEQIIDLVNGLKDLKSKTIRTVGKTEKRFAEDYLRMLRALRLSHQLSFKLDKELKLALLKSNKNIKKISKERVLEELMKMFSVGRVDKALKLLNDYGLFEYIFPKFILNKVSFKKIKNKNFNQTHLKSFYPFWNKSFSFLQDPAFCWTVIGLPVFYSNSKNFESFLKSYPLEKNLIKQAVSYLKSVQTLISPKSSFTDQLLALNGQKKQVYELTFNLLESIKLTHPKEINLYNKSFYKNKKRSQNNISNKKDILKSKPVLRINLNKLSLKNQQKLKTNLKCIMKEFKKREKKAWLPPPLIKGSDLLKLSTDIKKQNFSKILKQAYILQMEKPKLNKKEILKTLNIS